MTTPDQIGARIRAARIDQGYGVKGAAQLAKLARDTWYRIEEGKPVHDAKRHAALKFLNLDSDGLPKFEIVDEPEGSRAVEPRLNNIERQIDALWRRIEELGGVEHTDEVPAKISPLHPTSSRFTAPNESEDGEPDQGIVDQILAQRMDLDEQLAARDRDVHGNPIVNIGRKARTDQDAAATAPDPEGPEGGA